MDARTVTALDATTAFAVPDPGRFLAKLSVFSGPDATADYSAWPSHPVYFGSATDLFSLTLSTVDIRDTNLPIMNVNTQEWCNSIFLNGRNWRL